MWTLMDKDGTVHYGSLQLGIFLDVDAVVCFSLTADTAAGTLDGNIRKTGHIRNRWRKGNLR